MNVQEYHKAIHDGTRIMNRHWEDKSRWIKYNGKIWVGRDNKKSTYSMDSIFVPDWEVYKEPVYLTHAQAMQALLAGKTIEDVNATSIYIRKLINGIICNDCNNPSTTSFTSCDKWVIVNQPINMIDNTPPTKEKEYILQEAIEETGLFEAVFTYGQRSILYVDYFHFSYFYMNIGDYNNRRQVPHSTGLCPERFALDTIYTKI